MAVVPIEYLVIAFPDGNVSDEIAPELADLVDKKVIRILDMVFVAALGPSRADRGGRARRVALTRDHRDGVAGGIHQCQRHRLGAGS